MIAGVSLWLASRRSFCEKTPVQTPMARAPPDSAARISFGCKIQIAHINTFNLGWRYLKRPAFWKSVMCFQTQSVYATTLWHNKLKSTLKTLGSKVLNEASNWGTICRKMPDSLAANWFRERTGILLRSSQMRASFLVLQCIRVKGRDHTVSPTWARKRNPPWYSCSARVVAILTISPRSLWSLPNLYKC